MKRRLLFLTVLGSLVFFFACQKELSLEIGKDPSAGTLQSDITGDCLPKTVAGTYEKGLALNSTTNYIEIEVDVLKAGSYVIGTDTINGIYFRAVGIFTSPGTNTVKLKGFGTPLVSTISNFTVSYDSTECVVAVTVLPSGSSGPAVFALEGSPGSCMNYNLSGTYVAGTALNTSNFVTINVSVTSPGTYNISTVVSNGIVFSGSGAFIATGAQTIKLTASGTPAAAGNTNIPVTAGTSTCSFAIAVVGPATFLVSCATAVVTGTYEEGVALSAGNTVNIDVNVTAIGGYSVTGTINGMTFSNSGNFTTTGPHTITLQGTGTPVADGAFNVPVTGGTGSCNFPVTVDPGAAPSDLNWKFTQGSLFQGPTTGATEASFGGSSAVSLSGTNTAGDWTFLLVLNRPGAMQTGAFNSNSITNGALFTIINTTTAQTVYSASFGDGTNFVVNITKYDTVNDIIEGNFSGTVKNTAGATVTITGGTFKAQLF
ncbi:MAG: hypothetical protein WDN26_24170 [Chitinophagaceae bacterium]